MTKFRVMIVDDESIARIGLKSIVDWDNSPFVIAGDAKDGRQALELARRLQPDIVLTDIKMPGMDGIELIRRLKERSSTMQIVVLSSHNDFHLVREAMKVGASDYLLKLDIDSHTLLKVLHEAAQRIELPAKDAYTHCLPEMQRNYLKKVVSRFYLAEDEVKDTLQKLEIELLQGCTYALLIKAGELYRFEDIAEPDLHTLTFSVLNIAEEIAQDYFHAYCFEVRTGEFAVLMTQGRTDHAMTPAERVYDTASRIRTMLDQYLNLTCYIGVGTGEQPIAGIAAAYERATQAVGHRFHCDNSGIIVWHAGLAAASAEGYDITQEKQKLFKAIERTDVEAMQQTLQALRHILHQQKLPRKTAEALVTEVVVTVRMAFEKLGIPYAGDTQSDLYSHDQFFHLQNIREIEQWLDAVEENLRTIFEKRTVTHSFHAVQKASAFIKSNFRAPLTLDEVAMEVNLSPSYLSSLFKNHYGMRYTEYLTDFRIQEAKKLLSQTDWKIYEVGMHVGFDNKFYFNRVFKQITGLSPGDYRKLHWSSGK